MRLLRRLVLQTRLFAMTYRYVAAHSSFIIHHSSFIIKLKLHTIPATLLLCGLAFE
jgi:hypothetical protein